MDTNGNESHMKVTGNGTNMQNCSVGNPKENHDDAMRKSMEQEKENELTEQFRQCARDRDLKTLEKLLQGGFSVNKYYRERFIIKTVWDGHKRVSNHTLPLNTCIIKGWTMGVECLLRHGADVTEEVEVVSTSM